MESPKVSIITVCYNSERTIEQTILSVLGQTYKNIEYIIVDGASKDNTLEIIKKYKQRIKVISEPDNGIYHAMNKGIMKSSGDIIGIINSDDWYEENAVELAVQYLSNATCDLVHGRYKKVYENGIMQEMKCGSLEDLRYKMTVLHPTVFVKKTIYEKYGIFNQKFKIAADYDLMLRFYEAGVRMVEIPENISYFRMSGTSNTNFMTTIEEAKEIALLHWDGESTELKRKIEKYANCRYVLLKSKEIMQHTNYDMNEFMLGLFHDKRDYVIFGAGDLGLECKKFFNKNGCAVQNFIDNDPKKWNIFFAGIDIKSPDFLLEEHKNVIVASAFYEEEINNQLAGMGYKRGIDFICIGDLLNKVENINKV